MLVLSKFIKGGCVKKFLWAICLVNIVFFKAKLVISSEPFKALHAFMPGISFFISIACSLLQLPFIVSEENV